MRYFNVIVWSMLSVALYGDSFSQAVEAYNQKGYIKAFNTFYIFAQKGNAKAQYNVGLMYANGKGVKQNILEAKKWYEKSAKQGNVSAQYNLAYLYHTVDTKDIHHYEKAKYWYEKAIVLGDPQSYNNLATLYVDGLGVDKDLQKAVTLFEKAVALGNSEAKVNVAMLYAWGEGVKHDKMRAYEYLKSAHKAGRYEAGEYLDRLCKQSQWVCQE